MIQSARLLAFAALVLVPACSSSGTQTSGGSGGSSSGSGAGTTGSATGGQDGGIVISVGTGTGTGTGTGGAQACEPPDVIIALDRTLTMSKTPAGNDPTDTPAYGSSKWYQALAAIKGLVTPKLDQGIRFGLEMWPKDSGGCVTLAQRLTGSSATNTKCQGGEILVPPDVGTSAAFPALLDPTKAHICRSTPTGQGLLTASDYLATHKKAGRAQYIMLVTDGSDWANTCPTPDPVMVTQKLAMAGIKTFVLGFSAEGDLMVGGVGAPFLNDMACAGMTAVGFPGTCILGTAGYTAKDPKGALLYLQASDGAALTTAFSGIATQLCCDCVH